MYNGIYALHPAGIYNRLCCIKGRRHTVVVPDQTSNGVADFRENRAFTTNRHFMPYSEGKALSLVIISL